MDTLQWTGLSWTDLDGGVGMVGWADPSALGGIGKEERGAR